LQVTPSGASGAAGYAPGSAIAVPATFNNTSHVANFGGRYAWTENFATNFEFEFVRGLNATNITVPAGPGNPAAYELGQYSLVQSNTVRISLGADYRFRPRATMFARYNYYDFEDFSPALAGTAGETNTNATGQAHMILGGMSATF